MSKRIPQNFIQDVLNKTDIIGLIDARVTLKKKGGNYSACCPFHQEKTPSFSASQDKQFYYCFGCSAHGNAITFLMEYEHLSFLDALEQLATPLGLELPQSGSEQPEVDKNLYLAVDRASNLYKQALRQSQQAIDYLKNRGISGKTAKDYAVGYAPTGWQFLVDHHQQKRELTEALKTNGLIIAKDSGRQYDRFRHRIMFPIRDVRGRTIAFGGRSLNNEDQPKYLNSPETPIFHKGHELYGLFEALKATRKLEQLLIVEGYMDVIGLAEHGVKYAVATLGTAIGASHLTKLFRYADRLTFCFDGDRAGQQAAWKALTITLPLMHDGRQAHFIMLPKGEDPDSFIQKNGQPAFENLISNASPLSEFFFTQLAQTTPLDNADSKAKYAKEAAQYLKQLPPGIFYQFMEKKLAETLALSQESLQLIVQPKQVSVPTNNATLTSRINKRPVHRAISLLLNNPKLAQKIQQDTSNIQSDANEIQLLGKLIDYFQKNPGATVGTALHLFENTEDKQLIAQLAQVVLSDQPETLEAEFHDVISYLLKKNKKIIREQLINKAKTQGLTEPERQHLSNLLKDHEIS